MQLPRVVVGVLGLSSAQVPELWPGSGLRQGSRACLGPLLRDLGAEAIDVDWSVPRHGVLSVRCLLNGLAGTPQA